jgi:hypothetical protein
MSDTASPDVEAKRRRASELLRIDTDAITDAEVDELLTLLSDPDIQAILEDPS